MEEDLDQELIVKYEDVGCHDEGNELETKDLIDLLDEITARCSKQTHEINKWLAFTQDFKKAVDRLARQTDAPVIWRMPRSPRTPTPRSRK